MWRKELDEFLEVYNKWYKKRTTEFSKNILHLKEIVKTKKSTTIKRKRKKKASKAI